MPLGRRRRSEKSSGVQTPESSVTSDFGRPGAGQEINGLDSVIVHGTSIVAWDSGYNSDRSPDSAASSAYKRFGEFKPYDANICEGDVILDGEKASILIRKLSRALEVTTCELRKTELELKEALSEVAQLRAAKSIPIPRTKRSGSCPTTFSNLALPLPTSALFSAIHRIIRQDSY